MNSSVLHLLLTLSQIQATVILDVDLKLGQLGIVMTERELTCTSRQDPVDSLLKLLVNVKYDSNS